MGHLANNQHSGSSWKFLMIGLCVLALTMGTVGSAAALTLNFSNVDGATIAFNGTGQFSFPDTGLDFVIGSENGGSAALGLYGNLDGTFAIGSITSQTIAGIIYQTATVTGSGAFRIYDGSHTLVAALTWPDINTLKYNTAYSTGTLNFGSWGWWGRATGGNGKVMGQSAPEGFWPPGDFRRGLVFAVVDQV